MSPAGSHKPNTAVPQAYYNKKEGIKRIATETGAGQWGSALAFAGQLFGIEIKVYMVRVSYDQKPYRRIMMETWGAKFVASPAPIRRPAARFSPRTRSARAPRHRHQRGRRGRRHAQDAHQYSLGSVLNHVLLHQTVIGLETKKQMEMAGEYPDVWSAASAAAATSPASAYPFLRDKLAGKAPNLRVVAIEPTATPSLTRGVYAYDYGDTAMMAPIVKMYTLGHGFMPAPIHAGGLRYHGMARSICELYRLKLIEARAVQQLATFEAGCSSRTPRASSRRPSPRTRSAAPSTRRSAAARRARARSSSST